MKVAELLTLCGVKHIEFEPRRGDYVTDASHSIVLFDDTATSPQQRRRQPLHR